MGGPRATEYSHRQIRQFLLRYDCLTESGLTQVEAADRLGLRPSHLRAWKKREAELFDVPGPWKTTFQDRTWKDMPGADDILKKCNFALFRRGCLVLNDAGRLVPLGAVSRGLWRNRAAQAPKSKAKAVPEDEDVDLEGLREN